MALGGARGGLLMPIHWGLFNLALHAWKQPVERMVELADEKGIKLWLPEPGAPTEVVRAWSCGRGGGSARSKARQSNGKSNCPGLKPA